MNHLITDCELQWLHKILTKSSKSNYDIICTAPSRFYEQRLQDIPVELLGCQHESSIGAYVVLFFIVAPIVTMLFYKNRNYLRLKCQQKSQIMSNDADCSFEQHHIYEEIHSKHNESIINMMNHNNAVNSNIYSFGCPYPYQVQAVTQPTYLPTGIYNETIVPLSSQQILMT